MSGGTQETTTNTTAKPYPGSVSLINQGLKDAFKLYKSGIGSQVDTSSHVIPFSKYDTQAYGNLTNIADANSGAKGLQGNLQNIIDSGGFNGYQTGSLNNLQNQLKGIGSNGLTNGQDNVLNTFQGQLNRLGTNGLTGSQDNVLSRFQNQLQGLGNNGLTNSQDNILNNFQNSLSRLGTNGLTRAQDEVLQNDRSLANSSYDPNANPGSQAVLDSILRRQADQVNLNAAAAGRYGSGTHEGVLAREAGDTANQYITNDYNNWLGRRDAANQNVANLSQQGLGNIQGLGQNINALGQQGLGNTQQLGQNINSLGQQGFGNIQTAGGAINSLGQQGFQNRQGLSSTLFNAGQAGLGNMTNAYQGLQAPEQTRLGVGAAYDQKYADMINDRSRIFNAQQQAPWNSIAQLFNAANLGGMYKDTSGTTVAPGPNPFLQTLGGISTGAGLLGTLGLL